VRYVCPSKLCRWEGKQIHHGGDVCVLVFSYRSNKPSKWVFFFAGRDLAGKLLTNLTEYFFLGGGGLM
jgi:hypothetical protein